MSRRQPPPRQNAFSRENGEIQSAGVYGERDILRDAKRSYPELDETDATQSLKMSSCRLVYWSRARPRSHRHHNFGER
jgi:hypothetical protein